MNSQDFLLILLLPEKTLLLQVHEQSQLFLFQLCPPLSRVGDVFQIQGCISPLQFSILGISMCMLFYEVATSYRAVLSLWRLNKCLQSVWWSLQHSEGHMFCFLTIKASPSKILLLNKSPLLAFFTWQLWFDCKKQSLSSITDTFFLLHSAVTGIDKDSAVSRSEPLYQVRAYLENSEVQSSANLPRNIRRQTNTSNSTWT